MSQFYSAGFIYNPLSQQILLQKDISSTVPKIMNLFGGLSKSGEKPEETFKRLLEEQLHVKVKQKSIQHVYDYFSPDSNLQRHIFWVDLGEVKKIKTEDNENLLWIGLNQIHKAKYLGRTKNDLVFFQREMNAKMLSETTPESI